MRDYPMKHDTMTEEVKQMWESGQIRVLILTSLSIQIFLTFLAPLRKSNSNSYLKLFIWMLYLLADVIAMYIIGLIQTHRGHFAQKAELLAFWAPFLLLHLGGPDTITALALEDNELWRRHALQLGTQVTVTFYVFTRSLRRYNPLWLPTILMFFDGFIKYFERTCALFLASKDNFRESLMTPPEAGPNYARLMEEFYSAKTANLPVVFKGNNEGQLQAEKERGGEDRSSTKSSGDPEQTGSIKESTVDPNDKMVLDAHRFFTMCKTLLADGFLSLKDRELSRTFFLSAQNSFEILQIELNLIYDVFYTKAFLMQRKQAFFRLLCFVLVVASLVLFCFQWGLKEDYTNAVITFILIGGAVMLDISAAFMFVLSDWWVIIINSNKGKMISRIMSQILKWTRWARQPQWKRWSKTISKYSLLRYCFRKPPSILFNFKGIFSIKFVKDFLIGLVYVTKEKVDEEFIKFILTEIHKKAELAEDTDVAKKVYSARGNLVLQDEYYLVSECLSPWTVNIDYDESVLIWHLATEICYYTLTEKDTLITSKECKFSKALSDYMLYLLMWQQSLLSSVVGMSDIRFFDTCAEAKKFMEYKDIRVSWLANHWSKVRNIGCNSDINHNNNNDNNNNDNDNNKKKNKNSGEKIEKPAEKAEREFYKIFSKKVMKVKAVETPLIAKGDKSKSVLFDACRLAKQLEMFGDKKWDIMSKVWVELLCYAATRCMPRYHIAQLRKGGELITFVWLYMAHLGLGERFMQNRGFGWTKLIIDK